MKKYKIHFNDFDGWFEVHRSNDESKLNCDNNIAAFQSKRDAQAFIKMKQKDKIKNEN